MNPLNNAFNGTNSFTNASDLYNMDIDVYNLQNNISIGDTTATIELTSGQDFVMINNIITVLNSQLPDATITLDAVMTECNDRLIEIDYTVFNLNSTDPLPANTPIAFYANSQLIGQGKTQNSIPINGSETGNITILIPEEIPQTFILQLVVDDDGSGNGIVTELNENNNSSISFQVELLQSPPLEFLGQQLSCDVGFNSATFNLIEFLEQNNVDTQSGVSFYSSIEDLESQSNEILIPESYSNQSNPETIYVRSEDIPCFSSYAFEILVENCPPVIPEGFSPNDDGKNDWFNIQGLYNIFEFHELQIYNRYGEQIFEGNNDNPWLGRTNRGINNRGVLVPVGTYYYILNLNDPNYRSIVGWVYVNY